MGEGDIRNCFGKLNDPGKPAFRRLGILPQQLGTSRMALRKSVSRFYQMVCVFRTPDNSDIILIFSLLHVA
jgi:hypothetical protein